MKNNLMSAVIATAFLMVCTQSVEAGKFSVSFKWGKIPYCNDGFPGSVSNPIFTLSNVPTGTKKIEFEMEDLDYSSVQGGGAVAYTEQKVIEPGAFKYESPCPPGRARTYEWTALAIDASGNIIGKASARKKYPAWRIPEPAN